jgi:hypothetical protein
MSPRKEHVDKTGASADPDHPQPEAAEVESARLLANDAKPHLEPEGFSEERIRELADEYVALDLGADPRAFVEWAMGRGPEE